MTPTDSRSWIAASLAWVLPGAGHLYLGQTRKGFSFFLALVLLFLWGVYLGSRPPVNPGRIESPEGPPPSIRIISPQNHPFVFAIQALAGGPAMAVTAVTRAAKVDSPTTITDLGQLITLVVGALNFLLIVDAFCWQPKDAR